MNKTIKIVEINQDGNIFYVGKMLARELAAISTTKVRYSKNEKDYKNFLQEVGEMVEYSINEGDIWYLKDFDVDPNIQRKESLERLKEIGEYIDKTNSIFPNAIICNISLKETKDASDNEENDDSELGNYISISNDEMTFDTDKVEISIIDGQHRLGGFRYADENNLDKYELLVTFLIGLLPAQQAELFATINGKQKSVNKSVLYDLSTMSEEEYSMQMMAHLMVTWFNVNEKSPLKNKIKMLGSGSGTISQAAMIDAVLPMLNLKSTRYKWTDKLSINLQFPIFYKFYEKRESKYVIQNLYDYLNIVKQKYKEYWNVENNSILIKTTGINGLLMAYPTIYAYLVMQFGSDLNRYNKELATLFLNMKHEKFVPIAANYVGGGKQIQKEFACDLLKTLFDEKEIVEIRNKFIDSHINKFISAER